MFYVELLVGMQFCSVFTFALLLFNHKYIFYLLDTGWIRVHPAFRFGLSFPHWLG